MGGGTEVGMDRWKAGGKDGGNYVRVDGGTHGGMDIGVDGGMDGEMKGWVDVWTAEWRNGMRYG